MLNVYLDGNLVNEPIGLNDVTEHLYYATSLSSYVLEVDGSVTFTGSEYTYLRDKFDENVCYEATIRIFDDETNEIDFDGLIKVADIEFIPDKLYAICEIQNNNITAKVENNRSIECVLNVGKSKNSIDYTVTTQTDITIYDPTGANTVTREGIRIYDAFESILNFISDGELGFESDYFDPNVSTNEQAFSVLMNGNELRDGTNFAPTISFADLFDDLNSLENLAMAYADGKIRIEDKDYFKQDTSTVTFENVKDLAQNLATESLYARVRFGSSSTLDSFDYLQDIRFAAMAQESYHLGGQCNTDTELDLRTVTIITDANIIQDVIPAGIMGGNANSEYDENVLIIHCDSNNNAVLTPKPASATDFYYNDRFTNRRVALRWLGQVPQSIYAFLGGQLNQCYINQVGNDYPTSSLFGFAPTQESPLPWNDANGNYAVQNVYFPTIAQDGYLEGGGLLYNQQMDIGIYTAPANGVYSFEFNVRSDASTIFIHKMYSDTVGGAADGYAFQGEYIGGDIWQTIGGATFYLDAGEYVGVRAFGTGGADVYYASSTFQAFDPNGGAWQTYNAAEVYQIENKMRYPIPVNDWKTVKLLPFQSILLTYQTGQTNGWLKDITRNLKTGMAEVVLLGRNNNG
jgi:hypothetical protein